MSTEADALRELQEFAATREEALTLLQAGDDDVASIIKETEAQMDEVATRLAALRGILITSIARASEDRPPAAAANAPITEVQWDDGTWYSGWATAAKFDFELNKPVVVVRLLGYGIDERATLERVRPWTVGSLTESLQPGTRCSFVSAETGAFVPAVVERATLRNTVWVKPQSAGAGGAAAASGTVAAPPVPSVEVPFSHVRVGRVYRQLKKQEQNMTPSERVKAAVETRNRKREREEDRKNNRFATIEASTSSWNSLTSALGF